MKSRKYVFLALLVVALLVALPSSALANKRLYQAKLAGANEVPPVASDARGSLNLGMFPDGRVSVLFTVRNLSGPATGAHLHGPADATQNAPVIITLCGNPAPSLTGAPCPWDAGTNGFALSGDITPSLLQAWGITGAQFRAWADAGLIYVNVHTAANPAGEARGQINPL